MSDWTGIAKETGTGYLNPEEGFVAAASVEAPGVMIRGMGAGIRGAIGTGLAAAAHNKAIEDHQMTAASSIASTLPLQKAVIAVTNQRFLMFTYGGMTSLAVKDVIFELSLDQVDHTTFEKGKLVDKLELIFVDGSAANFEIGRAANLGVIAEALGSAPV